MQKILSSNVFATRTAAGQIDASALKTHPIELEASLLGHVAGGGPKGTWGVATLVVEGPKGTW